jgi:GntR family transcriptional regulator
MTENIERRTKIPIFRQVAAILRDRIRAGTYGPGEPIPSEAQLCAEFDVAPMTARKSVRVLASEGLVEVVAGRGAFVKEAAA